MTRSLSLPQVDSDAFAARLAADGQSLRRASLRTLQLNLGKLCNIACHHCHVEAGPSRTEVMTWQTMEKVLAWIDEVNADDGDSPSPQPSPSRERGPIEIVDLTGGSPEMNPHFKRLVRELRSRGLHVLDRCNPTILEEPGYEDMPAFLAEHGVEIVASLPCYLEDNVDAQRGRGVFAKSIAALRKLNAVGYGRPESPKARRPESRKTAQPESRESEEADARCSNPSAAGDQSITDAQSADISGSPAFSLSGSPAGSLILDLVYNPVGFGLPPAQAELERAYKQHLRETFGVTFNRLWTITNMPIKRFAHALRREGKFAAYMDKLTAAHNADNVDAVMCRSLISVGWRGSVYDCDFNQMLQMPVSPSRFGEGDEEYEVERDSRKLWEYSAEELLDRTIRTGDHCFGCTAGAGSSCTGALS